MDNFSTYHGQQGTLQLFYCSITNDVFQGPILFVEILSRAVRAADCCRADWPFAPGHRFKPGTNALAGRRGRMPIAAALSDRFSGTIDPSARKARCLNIGVTGDEGIDPTSCPISRCMCGKDMCCYIPTGCPVLRRRGDVLIARLQHFWKGEVVAINPTQVTGGSDLWPPVTGCPVAAANGGRACRRGSIRQPVLPAFAHFLTPR